MEKENYGGNQPTQVHLEKMAVKTQSVCFTTIWHYINIIIIKNEQA